MLGVGLWYGRGGSKWRGISPFSLLVLCVLCLSDPIVCPSLVCHVCCPQLISPNCSLFSTCHFGSSLQEPCCRPLTMPRLTVHLPAFPNNSKKALFLEDILLKSPLVFPQPCLGWPWGVRAEFLIPPFPFPPSPTSPKEKVGR